MSNETEIEHELRRTLQSDLLDVRDVPDLSTRIRYGVDSSRRLRRAGASIIVLGASGVAAAIVLGGSPLSERVTDVAGGPGQGVAPGSDCTNMRVEASGANDQELVVALTNTGQTGCDVRGLVMSVEFDSGQLIDRATDEDIEPGSPLADRPLEPGAQALLRVRTYPGCQFENLPITVNFTDGSNLDLTYPDLGARQGCDQPAPLLEVIALGPTDNMEAPQPTSRD